MRPGHDSNLTHTFNWSLLWAVAFAAPEGHVLPCKVVHGPLTDRDGPLKGLRRVGAWVEVQGLSGSISCVQVAPGNDEQPWATYYQQARVERPLVRRYSVAYARRLAQETDSAGPWDPELIEIQRIAQYRLSGRQGRDDV